MQPICNRYLTYPTEEEYTHSMEIGQCKVCGLIQISNPIPVVELVPRYDWISYNEPESHLDNLVERISGLPGITNDSQICGISFKDDSLLLRLKERGYKHIWRIDPEIDLGIIDHWAGVEKIQERFTLETVQAIARKYGEYDVIIARHILEHSHEMHKFMMALKQLLSPCGYLIIEVPDCSRALEEQDYSMLWEEHIVYFSPNTFHSSFSYLGLSVIDFERYPHSYEDTLVGIVRSCNEVVPFSLSEAFLKVEQKTGLVFSGGLIESRNRLKRFLHEFRKNHGKIALFGAGHLACTYINLLEVKDYFEFVADDNSNKQGLFMPGSHLPILEPYALVEQGIKLCLLSISPENEDKVIQNNYDFAEHGGSFSSIFPMSKYALQTK